MEIDDICSSHFLRREKIACNSLPRDNSILLNAVPANVQRTLERPQVESDDYIVKLDKPTLVGSKRVVWLSDSLFAPTMLRTDHTKPLESFEPNGSVKDIGGCVQLVAFRWSENYFHWTYQSMAGLLDMLETGIEIDRLVVTPLNKWRRRTLELLGIDPDDCIEISRDESVQFDSAIYSSYVSQRSVSRPTQRLINLFDDFSSRICSSESYAGCERIYVSRANATKRKIENEHEICHLVSQYGFEVIQTENLDVDEQINLFAGARHVVAPHGAGLANLLYSQRCESVTEILQAGSFNQCMFRICQAKGIPHYSLQAECARDGVEWRAVSKVDLNVLESHLDDLVSNCGEAQMQQRKYGGC